MNDLIEVAQRQLWDAAELRPTDVERLLGQIGGSRDRYRRTVLPVGAQRSVGDGRRHHQGRCVQRRSRRRCARDERRTHRVCLFRRHRAASARRSGGGRAQHRAQRRFRRASRVGADAGRSAATNRSIRSRRSTRTRRSHCCANSTRVRDASIRASKKSRSGSRRTTKPIWWSRPTARCRPTFVRWCVST